MSEDLNGKKERKKERGVSNGSKMVMQEQATSNKQQHATYSTSRSNNTINLSSYQSSLRVHDDVYRIRKHRLMRVCLYW
jgi:hypothetical protein